MGGIFIEFCGRHITNLFVGDKITLRLKLNLQKVLVFYEGVIGWV